MRIRPFRNSDPPALVQLWRRLPPLPSRAQNISVAILEEHVFAKPYFDRLGLLVAESTDGQIAGFAHAAFGVDPDQCRIDASVGVVALFVPPDEGRHDALAGDLLAEAENYLRIRGARKVLAGGVSPHHPFYLGLCGGALLPGIVASDRWLVERFLDAGYHRTGERSILRRSLRGFRPPVNRELMRIRRSHRVAGRETPVAERWCEACTLGILHRRRFELISRIGADSLALLDVWDMEPLASSWGLNAMGVCHWSRCEGPEAGLCQLFLLGETMRLLSAEGVSILELQVDSDDAAKKEVCRSLGFDTVDRGLVLSKPLEAA